MTYYISQLFVLLAYACLGITYLIKNKNYIFLLSTCSVLSFSIAYILVSAWSGFVMGLIGVARNLAFFIIANKAKNRKLFLKNLTLSITFLAMIICSVFTFVGILSLMSVVATGFYTLAIFNEKGKFYKIFGILASVCWIIYNIFIGLYLSVFFEFIMVVCGIAGLLKHRKIDSLQELDKEEC